MPVLLFAFIFIGFVRGADPDAGIELPNPLPGRIVVHLKGELQVATLRVVDGPKSDDTERITACVDTGGTRITLDWQGSKDIRDELKWWSVLRHGDGRRVQAEVTGYLTFKRGDDLFSGISVVQGSSSSFNPIVGDSRLAPVPVVTIESLKIRLVTLEGAPQGNRGQFDRERVWAHKTPTTQ